MDISEGAIWVDLCAAGAGPSVCVCVSSCVCVCLSAGWGARAQRPLAPDVMTAGVWGLKIALCSQHCETEEVREEGAGGAGQRRGEVIEKNVAQGPRGR